MNHNLKAIMLILFGILLLTACSKEEDSIFLTQEERDWLEEHQGRIRIGYTTDYPPVEFLEDKNYVGMSADYFSLLEEKLNIDIKMVRFENWGALLQAAKDKQLTGITAATKTEERSDYLEFTVPYIMNPNVIITRKNFSGKLSFEKLTNASMKVLVVEGYSIVEELARDYPKLEYETVVDASEGMRKVSFSEADVLIVEVMSAAASIERDHISNLVVNTEVPYDSNLS
ncbi:MAG: transporter substrate-binding domain-containing protein, partial [Vallitaleaceae bacterium]|nr:transporter substrate-binding domain-containing protein [Vallitaleaceae bacterium]